MDQSAPRKFKPGSAARLYTTRYLNPGLLLRSASGCDRLFRSPRVIFAALRTDAVQISSSTLAISPKVAPRCTQLFGVRRNQPRVDPFFILSYQPQEKFRPAGVFHNNRIFLIKTLFNTDVLYHFQLSIGKIKEKIGVCMKRRKNPDTGSISCATAAND